MKLTISTATLLRHLAPCAEVVNARSAYAFGKCVLLTAKGTSLSIQSYNQPVSIRATVGGDALTVSTDGTVAVPAEEFHDRIKAIKDDHVTLSSDGAKLTIKGSGARKYTLGCFAGDGFPSFPARPSNEVTVSAGALASVLQRVAYAIHDDLSMPMFCGVTITAANDTLTASASNGHRIARATAPAVGAVATFIPGPAAETLLRVLDKGNVRIASSSQIVSCTIDGIELVYSLPPGETPGFDQVLGSLTEADGPVVDRRAMLAALKGITVEGTGGAVPIEIQSTGASILVRNTSINGDESSDEVACESACKWIVYVEAKYIIEALRSWGEDDVKIIAERSLFANQPLVLRCAGTSGGLATIARCLPAKAKEAA